MQPAQPINKHTSNHTILKLSITIITVLMTSVFASSHAQTSGDWIPVPDTVPATLPVEVTVPRPVQFALKANALYTAATVPTVGAELFWGDALSVSGNWSYAWWSRKSTNHYLRAYGGDLAVRWWMTPFNKGRTPHTGHHIGLYGQMQTYDLQFGGRGEQGAKFNYAVGVEYGFSIPLKKRLSLDLSLGLGYMWGKYHTFRPLEGHQVWLATKRRSWLGPTKAEVTFVWLLGKDNYNRRKGGNP